MKLFSDTDNPAGVAYFVPQQTTTQLYVNGQCIQVDDNFIPRSSDFPVTFNPPDFSDYIIIGIDTTEKDNIYLRRMKDEDRRGLVNASLKCKGTNRNIFPIESSYLRDKHIPLFNEAMEEYRQQTNDFYMTSFKSTQKSGKYRKRISFKEVRWLLEKVIL
jgi:hypothetical protein